MTARADKQDFLAVAPLKEGIEWCKCHSGEHSAGAPLRPTWECREHQFPHDGNTLDVDGYDIVNPARFRAVPSRMSAKTAAFPPSDVGQPELHVFALVTPGSSRSH